MKLSIIIPAYNMSSYLGKCVDSCEKQDIAISDYEVIIVNDGSTDNSLEIAETLKQKYSNIKIISQSNSGLSAARNTGLRNATGKYVWFVDSDDWIENNILNDLYSTCESEQPDMLWIRWKMVDEQSKALPHLYGEIKRKDESVMSGLNFMENVLSTYLFAWSFIYKREFLLKHNLSFTVGLVFEDLEFNIRAIPVARRVKLYDREYYNYLQRSSSIMHTFSKQKRESFCILATKINNQRKTYPTLTFFEYLLSNFIIGVIIQLSHPLYKDTQDVFLHCLKQNRIFKIKRCGSPVKYFLSFLFNISPRLCLIVSTGLVSLRNKISKR